MGENWSPWKKTDHSTASFDFIILVAQMQQNSLHFSHVEA